MGSNIGIIRVWTAAVPFDFSLRHFLSRAWRSSRYSYARRPRRPAPAYERQRARFTMRSLVEFGRWTAGFQFRYFLQCRLLYWEPLKFEKRVCHCERSEAISRFSHRIRRLLRRYASRNDIISIFRGPHNPIHERYFPPHVSILLKRGNAWPCWSIWRHCTTGLSHFLAHPCKHI